jgi:ACS family hexuronate transporter-like MFS transporter
MGRLNEPAGERSTRWRYSICGLLLLATMLNYMDRQTLSQLITTIQREYRLGDDRYGTLERGFGLAFASGALVFGFLADRLSIRWLYPCVLFGWSLSGIATAFAPAIGKALSEWVGPASGPSAASPDSAAAEQAYLGFLVCRVTLGFFEAGHWPCGLITTHIILTRKDRSFGNSLLQSGAALGAILTPLIVLVLLPARLPLFGASLTGLLGSPMGEGPLLATGIIPAGTDVVNPLPAGAWRFPFVAIGIIGMFWAVPWLLLVRRGDLVRRPSVADPSSSRADSKATLDRVSLLRMYLALVVVVITINLTWQFFRAWLPKFLEERRGYSLEEVAWLISAYYIAADAGCIGVGLLVKWLAGRGWDVHRARVATFGLCTGLALLSLTVMWLPAGSLLVGVLLLLGVGALGMFPNYYAFTQEVSKMHQGKVSGSLGTITWVSSAVMQGLVGDNIKQTGSYDAAIIMAGLVPTLALLALLLLWPRGSDAGSEARALSD